MTTYGHRYFILVPLNRLTPANNAANAWEPDAGRNKTFGAVQLSADGQAPASHTACCTLATEAIKTHILDAFSNVPFYRIYAEADGWTWASVLADAGLQTVVGE